jgi:hypothetical protein
MSRRDRFDVLERFAPLFEAPEPSFEGFLRRRDRKRRNQRLAAGVVGIAVFLAAVWIVTTGGPFDLSKPAVSGPLPSERVGFIGLPPKGAPPSTPEHGELVLSLYGGTTDGPRSKIFVYADGRLIWQREANLPYGANASSTGFLEQRLSPEGVELLRSEVVSTRLFDDDLTVDIAKPIPAYNAIQVRNGDRLVRVTYHHDRGVDRLATAEQESTILRLDARLADPASWLPASAWKDRRIKAYVPSTFQVCYGPAANIHVRENRILSLFPAPAEDLLRAAPETHVSNDPGPFGCRDMTTEAARALAQVLNDAGFDRDPFLNMWVLDYAFVPSVAIVPGPIENTVTIAFEPYLPHGEAICSPCG